MAPIKWSPFSRSIMRSGPWSTPTQLAAWHTERSKLTTAISGMVAEPPGNIEARSNAKVRHHWTTIDVAAGRAYSRVPCRGVCLLRQRIYDLGRGLDRFAVSRES